MRRTVSVLVLAAVLTALPVAAPAQRGRVRLQTLAATSNQTIAPEHGFSLAGLAWDSRSNATPSIRTWSGRWSAWTPLEISVDERPDKRSRERSRAFMTQPLWTGPASRIQVRWNGPAPKSPMLHLVDPGPNPRSLLPNARAMTAAPSIITRAQWGADEGLRRAGPRYAGRARVAFVHHTATANGYGPGDSAAIVRSVYAYHVRTNGWDDIGYNFLVDRYGQVFEGRHGGIEQAVIGAHAQGFNDGSTGISMIGTLSGDSPTPQMMDALRRLLAWKLDVHHIDPRATITFRSGGSNKWPEGTNVSVRTISGHRDVGQTDCPGDGMYAQFEGLRTDVAAIGKPKLYDTVANRSMLTPNGDGHADTIGVSGRGDETSSWTVEVRDRWGSVLTSATGIGTSPSLSWNGKAATGSTQPHGSYSFRVSAPDARPADVPFLLAAWPEGLPLRVGGGIYRRSGTTVQAYTSPAQYVSWGHRFGSEATVSRDVLSVYPESPRPGFQDGTLIHVNDGVYFISDGRVRPVLSGDDFHAMGLRWDAVVEATWDDATAHAGGAAMQRGQRPNGSLVRVGDGVWEIENGLRRPYISPALFTSRHRWEQIVEVSQAELLLWPPGPAMTFRDGSLVRASGSDTVWLIAGGLRHGITSERSLYDLGFNFGQVVNVSSGEVETASPGPYI